MKRFPSLFVSHGAPSFALEPGIAGPKLAALGKALPEPAAVLVVSPHWTTRQVRVTTSPQPQTIHDFGGFDPALYDISYPAPGHSELAERTIALLNDAGWPALADGDRGLDHGAWVPLRYLYPDAAVPVFQVSMPAHLDANTAYALGQALAPLAQERVLIVGSGSLTHNLYEFRTGHGNEEAYARAFVEWIRDAVADGRHSQLLQALEIAPHARRAHPTPEHYLPLLVALGAAGKIAAATLIDGGISHSVLSMDSFVLGEDMAATPFIDVPVAFEPSYREH